MMHPYIIKGIARISPQKLGYIMGYYITNCKSVFPLCHKLCSRPTNRLHHYLLRFASIDQYHQQERNEVGDLQCSTGHLLSIYHI
uniref:Uncharacterized protein n=1 Tax=Brassica oleracea TaxID=3712 RepID=A0A3P6G3Q6_BRAOL|nr:unnamed protein product [Brassica oleracea]